MTAILASSAQGTTASIPFNPVTVGVRAIHLPVILKDQPEQAQAVDILDEINN